MRRGDAVRLAVLLGWTASLLAYRHVYVEPREWAALCATAAAPAACLPRAGLLWMQHYGLWGGAALVLGIGAFLGAPLATAAVAMGIAGVVNYNASFGLLGAAIGFWAWFTRDGGAAAPAGQAAGRSRSRPATEG